MGTRLLCAAAHAVRRARSARRGQGVAVVPIHCYYLK
jgi:hypothetical protein